MAPRITRPPQGMPGGGPGPTGYGPPQFGGTGGPGLGVAGGGAGGFGIAPGGPGEGGPGPTLGPGLPPGAYNPDTNMDPNQRRKLQLSALTGNTGPMKPPQLS